MAKCVVLGGNGFIGSHLVDALSRAGHVVRAFDRFSSGQTAYVESGVEAVKGDFHNEGQVFAAVDGQDYVFLFLSATMPASAEGDPTLDLRDNVLPAISLLKACAEQGVKRVYFASSGGAIYGDQRLDYYSELDPTFPISPYGIGKLTIESYLSYFRAKYGLASVSLRIGNPFGGRQRATDQGLVPILFRNLMAGRAVMRFGDGTMVRDYIYIDDLIEHIMEIVGRPTNHTIYNIGSGIGRSVNEVLDAIGQLVGSDLNIVDKPMPASFVQKVVLDMRRFNAEFQPIELTDFQTAISRTHEQIAHDQ